MGNPTYETTRGTGRTLRHVLDRTDTHVREWWEKLERLDADLAAKAADLTVIDDEEFCEAGGNLAVHSCGSGLDWVWYRELPDLRQLAVTLLATLFRLDRPLRSALCGMFVRAIDSQDADRWQQVRMIANAAREWTIADAEARLGMTLDTAYLTAGVIPTWAIRFDPREKRVLTRNEEAYTAQEPSEFILCCLEGVHWESAHWEEYARRLFGAVPTTSAA